MSKSSEKKLQEVAVLQFLEERADEMRDQLRETKARRLSTSLIKDHLFSRQHLLAVAKIQRPIEPSKYAIRAASHKEPVERALNVILSDLHFGACLDQRELPVAYGHVEEARRLAHVVRQGIEYKHDHRNETSLNVHIIGDIMQGQLRDPRDGNPLAEQMAAAQFLLTQAVARFSEHFHTVNVYCTPGNHGRITSRHPDRATTEKWDALETVIYHGMKLAVRMLPNVKVLIPRTPWYAWKSFGQWGFATHGDNVFNIGYPGKSINIERARAEVNEINNSRTYGARRYDIFISGHVHTAAYVQLPNGPVVVTNGALIPADGYMVSRGQFDAECAQMMFESTPDYIFGDNRPVRVNDAEKDSSLDKLIVPFTDF